MQQQEPKTYVPATQGTVRLPGAPVSNSPEIPVTPTVKPDVITDKDGVQITLQEITGRTRLGFYRALGAKDAVNPGVVMELWPAMAVKSFNNEPVGILQSLSQLEVVYNRLDQGGVLEQVNDWLIEKLNQKADLVKEQEAFVKK